MGLTAERLRLEYSYDPDAGLFTRVKSRRGTRVGYIAGSHQTHARWSISIDKVRYKPHRLAWLYVYSELPTGDIDHINGNPLDNRIANLREVTHAQNMQNMRKARIDSTSGLIGAMPHQGRWRADLRVSGKKHFLGTFDTAQQAHLAYVAAKRVLHPFGTL